jgi:hypothetical protein
VVLGQGYRTPQGTVVLEVLTAVIMMSSVFRDITSCSLLKVNRRFEGTCHRHPLFFKDFTAVSVKGSVFLVIMQGLLPTSHWFLASLILQL